MEYKTVQEQQYIAPIATFSPRYKGDGIELLEDGRTLKQRNNGLQSTLLNHSGISEGIFEWDILIIDACGCITLGASPPGLVGATPGDTATMPGSIGMYGEGDISEAGEWVEGGFFFETGDTVILRLDFIARTITWTMKSDPSKTATRPLPQAGPYVLAVGSDLSGDTVRIDSFRIIQ